MLFVLKIRQLPAVLAKLQYCTNYKKFIMEVGMESERNNVNREYKDRLLKLVFWEKEELKTLFWENGYE